MNNLTTKQRLQHFVKEMGYGRNKFEEYVMIGSGYLSSKSTTISSDVIERVYRKFPNLNLIWLLTGQGEILMDSPAQKPSSPDMEKEVIRLEREIAKRDNIIAELNREIGGLQIILTQHGISASQTTG